MADLEFIDLDKEPEVVPVILSDIEKQILTAEVQNWNPAQLALVLSLVDSASLFKELEMRMNQFKFQMKVIKGVLN